MDTNSNKLSPLTSALYFLSSERGAGKTTIISALATLLRSQGYHVEVMKPVETGCTLTAAPGLGEGSLDQQALSSHKKLEKIAGALPAGYLGDTTRDNLRPEDALKLISAACSTSSLDLINTYRFAAELEPLVAANLAGVKIDIEEIEAAFMDLSSSADIVLVEGDHGVLSPLSEGLLQVHLISRLAIPAVLICPSRANTINTCLLNLEALKAQGVPVAGVIFNRLQDGLRPEEAAVPFQLEKFSGPLVRGVFPYFDEKEIADLSHLAQRLQVHIDLQTTLKLYS